MKAMPRCAFVILAFLAAGGGCIPPAAAQETRDQLPFRRAIELALRHSSAMAAAEAEQARARYSYLEARNAYLPRMVVGSGLAASYGFPMSIEGSAPSIVNFNSQQFLFNPAQREFIRAARSEWDAASSMSRDRRQAVILDAALAYLELEKTAAMLRVLDQQQQTAQRLAFVAGERMREGLGSKLEVTRAALSGARVRARLAEVEGAADLLRHRLAALTGLPAAALRIAAETIPTVPPPLAEHDDVAERALQSSAELRRIEARAQASRRRALGERKLLYPAVDLVAQYGLFSRHNNFDRFFQDFQRHNAVFGVAIRFPFFNPAQRARAQAAAAEAVAAEREVEGARTQLSAQVLNAQRTLRRLEALEEVARLEQELAVADADVAAARAEAGQTTVAEEAAARLLALERQLAFLDAGFAVHKARLELLRLSGALEDWALR